ncbi:MAG: NUMOD3 domain-containing DNA-binding protein, partial [Elusimicrobiota bacterium]|nr:NUMOD3 domain-containing DNA-binding protein [Elusimicrobiota bacterium]
YIGSSNNIPKRLAHHRRILSRNLHFNIHLQRAWNKYGSENFMFVIQETCSQNILIDREQHYIDYLNSCGAGYNISPTSGSVFGIKCSESTKKKLSIIKKGTTTWMKGKKHTEESKHKMLVARMARVSPPKRCPQTEETKQKISDAKRGKPSNRKGVTLSAETRKKMSKAAMGRVISIETRRKMSESWRPNGKRKLCKILSVGN